MHFSLVRPQTSNFDLTKKRLLEDRLYGTLSSNEIYLTKERDNRNVIELKVTEQEKIKKMNCANSVDLVAGSHYMEAETAKYPKNRRTHNRLNYSRDKASSSLASKHEPAILANSSSSK